MRIATAYLHDIAASSISDLQAKAAQTQLQISSGKQVSTAADDPIAAAGAVRARAALAQTGRWQLAQNAAKATLAITDSTLGTMSDVVSAARADVISAASGNHSAADRQVYAAKLTQALNHLVGLANTTDASGAYLFAGSNSGSAPFVQGGTSVSYVGDDVQRMADLGPGSRIAVTQAGSDAFMRIPSGNGVFATSAGAGNTGTGVVNMGRVTDAAYLTGKAYQVQFHVASGVTTYTLVPDPNAPPKLYPFAPGGGTIDLPGMSFEITGNPADGDVFDVVPSTSTSLFDRMKRAIDALNDPAAGSAADARRANELAGVLNDLDVAANHLIESRATAGNALARVKDLATIAQDSALAQDNQIKSIEDLDYAKAAGELTKRNFAAQAAMATYAQIGKKTLFDYL